MSIPSVYSPAEVEQRWYSIWESGGLFKPDPSAPKGPFTIVIPPPNVTGILHMGHALNNTLQDILIRHRRMQGHAALWVPGTDHAGIATQNVVERQLAQEKQTRQQLGREEFVKKVWAWKEIYGSTIVRQLRRLGASCDWSRERFTMDEGLSRAVETAFLTLHREGLIYRGYYLVNWCPRCQTALSDEEVVHEEVKGHLWHIRYPMVGGGDGVIVATTRPETMLGDVAVAVHPEDLRYRSLENRALELPILKRPLKIIQDSSVDREFGTGAVKVTPAHDPTDFLLGQKHGLEAIRVMTPDAKMNDQAGPYAGLDRFECRKRIIRDLETLGLLEKVEEHTASVGHCYRCRTIIEPTLSPQWFVRMQPLARLGIEAVEKDGLRFVPERWTKVYLDWLRNIRDWCISRQIWWGHRIPCWYCRRCTPAYVEKQQRGILSGRLQMEEEQAGIHVSVPRPPKCRHCGGTDLFQDEDVLDTWFSSWLWPFSTLGWPDQTPDLKKFYPTSVLVTGQDIIFFWVARMVMAGKFFLGKIPFKDAAIHGIIRVEGGKKMSKSLGNIIDPLEVIDRMGADALRFSLAAMTSEGQDLYLSENKFLVGRNFANKLWNAARLILQGLSPEHPQGLSPSRYQQAAPKGTVPPPKGTVPYSTDAVFPGTSTLADRWILSRFQQTVSEVSDSLDQYRFNEAAKRLYQFVWRDFCDWYLEIAKLQRQGLSPSRKKLGQSPLEQHPGAGTGTVPGTVPDPTDAVLHYVLEGTLRLLHPIMPFITEELWQRVSTGPIMSGPWPKADPARIDPEAEKIFDRLQAVITEVRNIRTTFRVPIKEKIDLIVRIGGKEGNKGKEGEEGKALLAHHEKLIQRLGSVGKMTLGTQMARPTGSVVSHLPAEGNFGVWDLIVPLADLVDLEVERQRIQKEIKALAVRAQSKRTRLNDSAFRSKAPADVVAEEEESLRELESELIRWTESLKQLGSVRGQAPFGF